MNMQSRVVSSKDHHSRVSEASGRTESVPPARSRATAAEPKEQCCFPPPACDQPTNNRETPALREGPTT